MAKRSWLDQVTERVDAEPGWRVQHDAEGRGTAYAPDGATRVRLMDSEGDPRWRLNTLADLRRAGLDLYDEFKSNSTRPKAERRKAKERATTVTRERPAPAPAPAPMPADIPAHAFEWHVSGHARDQAFARHVELAEVFACIAYPDFKRPTGDKESGRMIYRRGDLALVVEPEARTVVTVLPPTDRDVEFTGKYVPVPDRDTPGVVRMIPEKRRVPSRMDPAASSTILGPETAAATSTPEPVKRPRRKHVPVKRSGPAEIPANLAGVVGRKRAEPDTAARKLAAVPATDAGAEPARFAASLSDEFLLCREMGHTWQPWQAYWDDEAKVFERALRCPRCRTSRWQQLTRTGERVNGSGAYKHPDGYLHKGGGPLVGKARDALRLESVTRVVNETMRGVDRTATDGPGAGHA